MFYCRHARHQRHGWVMSKGVELLLKAKKALYSCVDELHLPIGMSTVL